MKIRLSDADRERLGCPEWLDVSLETLPVREAEALESATGMEPSDAVRAMMPTVQAHPDDPGKVRLRYTPRGARLMVWLGLYRAGVETDIDTLDFDYSGFAGWREVARDEGGKGEASPSDAASTSSTSAISSRSRRKA